MKDKLTASEGIYGFAAWLTCRDKPITIGSTNLCSPVVDLVAQFCKENKLNDPRDGWENNLIHPSGECSKIND